MKKPDYTVTDCKHCDARDSSVFCNLNELQMRQISISKGCKAYPKGEIVFYADELPSGLYCIHRGKIKVYKMGSDGKEQIVRLAKEGDILGYRALVSGERYAAYAVPVEPSQICHIPKDVFFSVLSTDYNLMSRLLALLSNDLKVAEERIVEFAQKPVRERIAETLLLLAETYGLEQDGMTLSITLTRTEIASITGTTTESASRQLSKLHQEGIIDTVGRKLKIIDRARLIASAHIDD
jgi:CRP/FNR family transcriptional regulator, polysaccharide utilization system transcription regulator